MGNSAKIYSRIFKTLLSVVCCISCSQQKSLSCDKRDVLLKQFLHNIKIIESNNGKNISHAIITKGPFKGYSAIGSYGLLPTTITELSDVIAVGSPKGYENNVSESIVGGKDRIVFFFEGAPEYIFTDAQVLPGNSGGPLIELDTGTVINMMSLIIPAEGLYGLNAALPVERIRAMLVR